MQQALKIVTGIYCIFFVVETPADTENYDGI